MNKEVKRRADVVGIFPNEEAIIRLIGAVLLEQNDERQLQHRYIQLEAMAETTPALARRASADYTQSRLTQEPVRPHPKLHHLDGRDPIRSWRCSPESSRPAAPIAPRSPASRP